MKTAVVKAAFAKVLSLKRMWNCLTRLLNRWRWFGLLPLKAVPQRFSISFLCDDHVPLPGRFNVVEMCELRTSLG
ncbi:hypothetical protein [Neorhodopirellula lusitana]|uniref:hypothetical protein n=1 Tax=Neorhodopirellula lusitana TaxID=445327 RepID=UPI00384B02D5